MITPFQMAGLLSDSLGANFVTIETRTVPKLLARHPISGEANPFRGNIVKVAIVNGVINWVYERAVNRQRTREELTADFQAMPRKWGHRMAGTPLVEHNGQYYLELKVERSIDYRYEAMDRTPLDKAAVNQYLTPPSASRQGVEKTIILRDYKIDNITRIKYRGQEFRIAA